ncbi:MAG: inositol monophosphatase family protein [Gemmatimonadota bacterium]
MNLDPDDLMDFAVRTATAAGEITLGHFGRATVEFKGDGSEVTEADRASEAFIRSAIAERFPAHGVFGEEGANITTESAFRWIVDPIDGTRSFASGVPLYGVLLALEVEGAPWLGCAHFPALGDTVVAARGAGCWRGDRPARVSACDDPGDARLVTSGLEYWRDWATPAGRSGFESLVTSSRFARTWGDCFGYVLVATGRAEILADPACGAHWDYAPMVPIIEEAGGRFTTLGGDPVGAWTSALATNPSLHASVTALWNRIGDEAAIQNAAVRARREP